MRRTSRNLGLLITEVNNLKPKLIGQQKQMEALLRKYEAEENYELCALVVVYFDHLKNILKAADNLES